MRLVLLLVVVTVIVAVLLPFLRRAAVTARRRPLALDDELVKDPVCQTYIVRSRAVIGSDARGEAAYFCSAKCARRYAG